MIWPILASNIVVLAVLSLLSRRLRKVVLFTQTDGMEAARNYIRSTEGRALIAKAARSIAKDYLQDHDQDWRP